MWTIIILIWCGLGFISFLYCLKNDINKKKKIVITEYIILLIITLILGGIIFVQNCKDILK